MEGRGEEEDFCAFPQFQICHYTTGFGSVLSVSFSALTRLGDRQDILLAKKTAPFIL